MTPTDRFYKIIEDGLCIGCGLCQSVAGENNIRVKKGPTGDLRPHVVRDLDEATVDKIYATCPSTRVEPLPPELIDAAPKNDLVWGPYYRLTYGWAGRSTVRHEGSTAGVLTALGQYLLKSKRVKFILHVKQSSTEANFGEPILSFTQTEVLEGAGSRYGPTAPLLDLNSVLDRDQPFAIIAKPCDLNAVRNLAHHDPRINKLVKYWLTMVCGGYMPDAKMNDFYKDHGITRDDVTALRYRGFGCPGPSTLHMKDGSRKDFHYIDFWGEDESSWSLPFRCKICPDGIGEGADIAVSDTWIGGSPNRIDSETDKGANAFIVRTQAGAELLDAAVEAGSIHLDKEIDIEFMNQTQPHQVTKKLNAQARFDGLAEAGIRPPETVNLRLAELAEQNGDAVNKEQQAGTYKRAMDGKQRESPPK